jgi:tRNA(Ile)-lysidine synthase
LDSTTVASNSIAPNHSAEKKQPGLLDRVRATIDQHQLLTHGSHVVVGVSGGPDSLTLLHCLRALRSEFKCTVHAAHLNHQLRGADSDADAEFVQAIVREWQLPATLEARDVPAFAQAHRLSIEEAARRARYLFLAQIAQ